MLKYSSGEVGQADINFSKNSAFFQSKKEHKYENTQTTEGDKHAYSGASALKKQPKSALLAAKQAALAHKASDKPAFFARKSTKRADIRRRSAFSVEKWGAGYERQLTGKRYSPYRP